VSNDFDFSEFTELTADLGEVPKKLIPAVRDVVEDKGQLIAADWADEASTLSGTHAKKYAKTIFSKMDLYTSGVIGASIKPRRGHQGNLGEVLELGGGSIKSSPQQAGRKALKNHESDFIEKVADAGRDAFDA
jgi:hypothetical protein